jgi:hypothetical protein
VQSSIARTMRGTSSGRLGIRKSRGEFIEAFSSDDMHKGHPECSSAAMSVSL